MRKLGILAAVAAFPFSVPVSNPHHVPSVLSQWDSAEHVPCQTDMECERATGYPYDVAMSPNPPKYPRLVGHGCVGARGPIYAFEEDHLPKCREIAAMDWGWGDKK